MATFEHADWCSLEEYREYEDARKDLEIIEHDELYIVMFSLKNAIQGKEAVKFPAKLKEYDTDYSPARIKLYILDEDLRPDSTLSGKILPGNYINCPASTVDGFRIEQGYIKDYEGSSLDDEFARMLDALSVAA